MLRAKWWRAVLAGGLVVLALAMLGVAALAKPAVLDARLGLHPDRTRFVLELSEEPSYKVFTLSNPDRVVIDVADLVWENASRFGTSKVGLVSGFRFGETAPGKGRVVLDVDQPVTVKSVYVIPPNNGRKHRLVLDLAAAADDGAGTEPVPASLDRSGAANGQVAGLTHMIPPPPTLKPDTRPTIVVDPGHGGIDPGTTGTRGTQEKDVMLAMAEELKAILEDTGRYKVALTRDDDRFLTLRERLTMGRHSGGDLFISLHADSHRDHTVRGASVYTLSEQASDSEAEALAAKENKADVIDGVDLTEEEPEVTDILIDLAQRETMDLSSVFASSLVEELAKVTKLRTNTHRFAGFAVLKAPDVPSVLVELGYLSNRQEERELRSARHRERLAHAIERAIGDYFDWRRKTVRQ
jgi:N-acetylmuramoyl-L-alanine amidase